MSTVKEGGTCRHHHTHPAVSRVDLGLTACLTAFIGCGCACMRYVAVAAVVCGVLQVTQTVRCWEDSVWVERAVAECCMRLYAHVFMSPRVVVSSCLIPTSACS